MRNYFNNRKTLKFKYLIIWAYIFLLYFLIRPYPSFRNGDVITNSNLYEFYRLFPIFIYLIIVIGIILEFLKFIVKDLKTIFTIPIVLPILLSAFIFISTPAGYQIIDLDEMFDPEIKFEKCYKKAIMEKNPSLRNKKENKCQRERFSKFPKLRDSFRD